MTKATRVQAARDHFDRTPIAPDNVRVLAQLGERWHWMELPAVQIWPAIQAFEREQPQGDEAQALH